MDFFASQDKARKKTKLLVFYFAVAVVLIILMVYVIGLVAVSGMQARQHNRYAYNGDQPAPQLVLWNPQIFLGASLLTLAVVIIGSAYKISELSGGGNSVAESLGGRLVNTNTTDPDERKLLNVVEEMAIASGVPMPQVFVLNDENGINAFAAGHTPSDAAIGVTRSCITKLTRDELQGVIGHEFSHILNGDMRLNVRLIGILFGILCLATIGRILLYVRSGNNRNNMLPLVGLGLLVIGAVGVFFGRLIQAAVSRQREFLADASSVQFTRNPAGLSGALQKVGGYGSRMASPNAPDAGHLFFGNGLSDAFFGALATHPPLEERIRAIDQTWDGKFKRLVEDKPDKLFERGSGSRTPMPDAFGKVLGGAVIASGDDEPPRIIKPRSVLPNLGNPTPMHLEYAEKLRAALPDSVKAATREPLGAVALIYALLLSPEEAARARQLAGLTERVDAGISEKTAALFPDVSAAATHARLPMVNLALGALRQLTAAQFAQFSPTLKWLIESDDRIELFEFVLQKIIQHHLEPQFSTARPPVIQFYTLKPLVPDCIVILSALAHVGSSDVAEIQKAFETGVPYLCAPAGVYTLLPREQCGVEQLAPALDRLMLSVPTIKKNFIEACAHTVGADGVIAESEAELLRAIGDTLDCPIPPFIPAE